MFAAAQSVSFEEASKVLAELSDVSLPAKRLWRATQRIGQERVEENRQAATRYEEMPLPARRTSPVAQVPRVACVQMDGGRFQVRERVPASAAAADSLASQPLSSEASVSPAAALETPPVETAAAENRESDGQEDEGCWREFKAGVLTSMVSEVHVEDPCPELPATFVDPGKMRERAREIKGFTTPSQVSLAAEDAEEETDSRDAERAGRPEVLVKSVVATRGDVQAFGPLLASAAYERGFHAAPRKAFLGDGSSTNWGVWRKFFSRYTPILDFLHALMYVYAAAMAGRSANEGWRSYCQWAQWLWSGAVDQVLAALEQRQQELGVPEKKETDTPRAQVACSLGYLSNHRDKMKYDEYRKQGLPLTSSFVESAIKQINRRLKGTEKFWSEGADPMLHLVADRLSQTNVSVHFWIRRVERIIQSAEYHPPGDTTAAAAAGPQRFSDSPSYQQAG